ncbi:LOW QUALITY PROTEIN: hemicentin-2-like [Scylla paramamosain]|uniref:LOW QUALITY PROTEIN: hemicentin-2-like n=1 Tax=Scylla paramamosain TaxID=85552 RepID=UPI0030836CD2
MTGRRATLLPPGVLRVAPRGPTSHPWVRPWGGRRPVLIGTRGGVTRHWLLLQLLLHAATDAKTTHHHLPPVEAARQASFWPPASIPFFLTREEPRQETPWPTPEPPAAARHASPRTAASGHHHSRHLAWPLEISSNVSRWEGGSYHGRHHISHNVAGNREEHVGNVGSGSNKAARTVPSRVWPSQWRRAGQHSGPPGRRRGSGGRHGTTGGSWHENLKGRLKRSRHPSGDNRGEIKANLVSGEAAWEARSMQASPSFPRRTPEAPSLSNKKKESVDVCVKSRRLASLPTLSPTTPRKGAWPPGEVKGPQTAQTPAPDIELIPFEDSVEDTRKLEAEENNDGLEWEDEEDEARLFAAPHDSSRDPRSILRRWKRKTEVLEVRVVEGGLAVLPCNLAVDDPRDSVQLILWIKEGVHTPLYSYDYRELLGGRPKETKPDANTTLARRTSFRTDTTPAALLVERVEAEDAGVYRCRVDHLLSPTTNTRTNLTVIVPPSRARISWRLGNSGLMPVDTPLVGPFLEGAAPTLVCTNDDGWPPPAVLWYEGQKVIDDTYEVDSDLPSSGVVQNELSLAPLTRADLGRRLTCTASNTNTTQPSTTTVTLDLTLSIVGVRVEEVKSAWAGEETEVECKVWGSRPPPSVVWWLGSTMLAPSHAKEEGNVTISVLKLTPKAEDDGAMLICQATNEKLPDQAVQDSRLLSINYAPVVEVSLGRSLDPARIKEGDDVYFECSVKAKPSISKVAWRHNGVQLVAGKGVFVSNMSLVVQRVTRARGGDYTCEATNARATSSSPALHLDVKYAPVCGRQERTQHSVAKLENAEVSCRVDANPPKVTFRWTFNNTRGDRRADGRFVVVGTESRVNYTPMNELDYGTLLCWANNSIGVQTHPCVFHIVAAGKPNPPHNCRVFDVTISSLQVTCLPGDDGGLSQEFLLQVYQVGIDDPGCGSESALTVLQCDQPTPRHGLQGDGDGDE